MSDARLDELLNAELDGQLDANEHAELEQLLRDDQARNSQRELAALDRILRDLPERQLPPSLHQRISSTAGLTKTKTKESSWISNLWLSPITRLGFAAAAGVLLSLAIFNGGGPDMIGAPSSEMLGSMVPQPGEIDGEIIDQLRLSGTGAALHAALLQRDQQLMLRIDLDATAPADLAVDFRSSGVQYESLVDDNDDIYAANFADSVLRLNGIGKRQFTVLLSREDNATAAESATIQLEFSSKGQASESGSLRLAH
ncbi:MAG: hypothetical protein HKN35_13940 [Woeseia sp.]|nr:hypothetical protein [Woeseia sp.]MBT8097993.1 hypothetical protein [Woeseia sp.]NNE61990.1 hypothetical protein [Woeseia sp.]NNL55128.1 hypothetical protein [Woeseia sp.]